MARKARMYALALSLVAFAAFAACSDGSGPASITLDDVSDPDSNTAVVVVDRDVIEGNDTVRAGVEEVYLVDLGLAPATLLGYRGLKRVIFSVEDLYSTEPFLTGDQTNTFVWVGPTGREYFPLTRCSVTVRSAYVPATPSTMWLETACEMTAFDGSGTVRVLVKIRRFGPPEEGP
jgi:hypothetical protein